MARVLIADDDHEVRQVIRTVLEDEGYHVAEAENGHKATLSLRQESFDLFICDLFMPNKDGLETIREMRLRFPLLRIIAISGGGFGGTMDMLPSARHFGADATLYKPFPNGELRDVVRALIPKGRRRSA